MSESPKYRVLKPMPGLTMAEHLEKKGSVYQSRALNYEMSPIYTIDAKVVENNPDYFELIEVPEFTHRDMENFASWCCGAKPILPHALTEWLEIRNRNRAEFAKAQSPS